MDCINDNYSLRGSSSSSPSSSFSLNDHNYKTSTTTLFSFLFLFLVVGIIFVYLFVRYFFFSVFCLQENMDRLSTDTIDYNNSQFECIDELYSRLRALEKKFESVELRRRFKSSSSRPLSPSPNETNRPSIDLRLSNQVNHKSHTQ